MISYDLPYDQYRLCPALGSTDIKNILKSPAHFRHARMFPTKSKALDFGTAVHTYLLETAKFFDVFAVEPEGLINKAKNPWKADWEKFKEANADKAILKREDWLTIKGIQASIAEHPIASKVLAIGRTEVSAIREDRKARADILTENFIADIKTTEDANDFIWSVQNFQYYTQAAYYLDLFQDISGRSRQFLWIVCEKNPPHCVKVCMPDFTMLEMGRQEYKHALKVYAECVESGSWPKYSSDIEELTLKPFYKGVLK